MDKYFASQLENFKTANDEASPQWPEYISSIEEKGTIPIKSTIEGDPFTYEVDRDVIKKIGETGVSHLKVASVTNPLYEKLPGTDIPALGFVFKVADEQSDIVKTSGDAIGSFARALHLTDHGNKVSDESHGTASLSNKFKEKIKKGFETTSAGAAAESPPSAKAQ